MFLVFKPHRCCLLYIYFVPPLVKSEIKFLAVDFQGTSPPLQSSQWDSIDTVPCTNTVSSVNTPGVHDVQENERAHSDTESDKKTENLRRAHSASDVFLEGLAGQCLTITWKKFILCI